MTEAVESSVGTQTTSVALEEDRADLSVGKGDFLAIALQVGLVLGAAFLYEVELERGFHIVAALIFLGFLIHSWLPLKYRLPFFLLLTLAGTGLLLKTDGLWLLALGLGLLGLCHLPLRWEIRVVLVFVAAAALALLRIGWFELPWAGIIIPVLAGMFMFRLILYLYDLKKDQTQASVWQRLSYFFLLPNLCFPLFPVVDYKTFIRTYYDAPASEIYQKGAWWLLRGLSHLLLYRIIYYLLPEVDSNLSGPIGVYLFMIMTYALYLRVSGLFHLIVGSLCLFGFNLPVTNNRYFLASSFTELWRRINIYWKDFMMTTVFYPIFVASRGWRMSARLIMATAIVFVITWFLHSYQWFWLQGVFPVTVPDIAFWSFLGVALAANSVLEARRGRKRRLLGRPTWSWTSATVLTLRTIAILSIMSVAWSLWYSESVAEWWYRVLRTREGDPAAWLWFVGLLSVFLLAGVFGQWLTSQGWGPAQIEQFVWRQASRVVPVLSIVIIAAGLPTISDHVPAALARFVADVKSTELNRLDKQRQERGYYETLSRANRLGSAPTAGAGEGWEELHQTRAVRATRDIRGIELLPNVRMRFKGTLFTTNRFGLRDREYAKDAAPGTLRVALLGSSITMGAGVANHETYENLLEERLNRELVRTTFDRYEVLNFGVGGYGILQSLHLAKTKIPDFHPDIVIYVAHPNEAERLVVRLRSVLRRGGRLESDYAFVEQALARSGGNPNLPSTEFSHRLNPYRDELTRWAYQRNVEAIRAGGSIAVFVFLPLTDEPFSEQELEQLSSFAREAGAMVISLQDVYRGYDPRLLRISELDNHPNVLGHRLIAEKLYYALLDNGEPLRLFTRPSDFGPN